MPWKFHLILDPQIEGSAQGKVTHFVSWCWAYTLDNVVTAVDRWLQKSKADPADIFLWICFFCNNQYRIMQEAGTPFFSRKTGRRALPKGNVSDLHVSHLHALFNNQSLLHVTLHVSLTCVTYMSAYTCLPDMSFFVHVLTMSTHTSPSCMSLLHVSLNLCLLHVIVHVSPTCLSYKSP